MNQQTQSQAYNSSKPKLRLALRNLKVSPEEVNDWKTSPVTRLFFWGLGQRFKEYRKAVTTVYVQTNADATHGRLAELMGAMRVLTDILNSKDADTDEFLVSLEDLEEVTDNEESIGHTAGSGFDFSSARRGADPEGNEDSAT